MKNVSTHSFNEIDYQYWKDWWEDWPDKIDNPSGRNLRPPTYKYDKGVEEIKSILNLNKKDDVLDVGCGTGEAVKLISPFVKNIVGIERAKSMIKYANLNVKKIKNAIAIQMDAVDITFPKETFSKVYSIAVIQYIHKDFLDKYITDMLYITKDGGKVLIGDIIPVNKKFDDANVTQIPKSYWKEKWLKYKPVYFKSNYEDRYHILLSK